MNQTGGDSIVLTGCGWVAPFAGGTAADVLAAVCPDPEDRGPRDGSAAFWSVPDALLADYPHLSKEIKSHKGAWMAAIALEEACRTAKLTCQAGRGDPRIGLVLGCSQAGQLGMIEFANEVRQQSPRFVSPIHFPQTVGNYIAGALARGYGIRGPNITLAHGVASGLDAIIEACRILASGRADVTIAGGLEQWSEPLAGSLAPPGTRLSEGACLLVVERSHHANRRGAKALATVIRWDHLAPATAGAGARGAAVLTGRSGTRIVSTAGRREAGAIFIEEWIGRCTGAGGAAAVAAVLGAAEGHPVPMADDSAASSPTRQHIDFDKGTGAQAAFGPVAVVSAGDDGGLHTVLELILRPVA